MFRRFASSTVSGVGSVSLACSIMVTYSMTDSVRSYLADVGDFQGVLAEIPFISFQP